MSRKREEESKRAFHLYFPTVHGKSIGLEKLAILLPQAQHVSRDLLPGCGQ
jgi:hypothetical protein